MVSPCTLIPLWLRPPLAGCAAGVEFLLLHLPLKAKFVTRSHRSMLEALGREMTYITCTDKENASAASVKFIFKTYSKTDFVLASSHIDSSLPCKLQKHVDA